MPLGGPCRTRSRSFRVPMLGVAGPLPAEPWRARSAPRHSRTHSPAIAPEFYSPGSAGLWVRGVFGALGPAARGSPNRMLRPSPGDRLWGTRPAPAPSPPAENNRRGPPPASPATSSTLVGRRALCDVHSPSGPGRRRPRAPTLQCGTRSRPVNCARAAGHRAPSQPCSFIVLVIWVLGCRGGPQRRHHSEPRERRSLDRPAKSNHETLVLE